MSCYPSDNDECSSPIADRSDALDIDLARIKNTEPEGFQSWAACKKQAWLQIDVNPNAFFYRHVLPGEERKNGPWSQEEKELFLKNIKKHPPESGHWGLFARNIPGRVGYQCNAYFKKLVAAGEIEGYEPIEPKEVRNVAPKKNDQTKENTYSDGEIEAQTEHKPIMRPKKKKNSIYVDFKGEEYAYDYNVIESQNFNFQPEDFDSHQVFHEKLLEDLKDTNSFERFVSISNLYFKIGK